MITIKEAIKELKEYVSGIKEERKKRNQEIYDEIELYLQNEQD